MSVKERIFRKTLQLPQFRGKHRLVSWLRRSFYSPYNCCHKNGFQLELDCFDWAQLELAGNPDIEAATMALIREKLKPGDVFVDVGCNIGFVSLVARIAVGEKGKVIAIEPQPYCCQRTLRNWEINGFKNLSLHVCAVGDNDGEIELPQQPMTDKSKLSLKYDSTTECKLSFTVPLRKLDSILATHQFPRIPVLKIDVEGYELSVLNGAIKSLDTISNIVFEAQTHNTVAIKHVTSCCDLLTKNGFAIFTVDGNKWSVGDKILENNLWASRA